MSALDRARREVGDRRLLRLPAWARTIRMRLTLTYSAVLFGITALALAAVYVALSSTISAEPLDPVTVKKFYKAADGTIVYKPGEQFQVADLESGAARGQLHVPADAAAVLDDRAGGDVRAEPG